MAPKILEEKIYERIFPLQVGYQTFIDRALHFANTDMFTSTNGARGAEIPKLLISITDGKQTERTWIEGDEEWVGKVKVFYQKFLNC